MNNAYLKVYIISIALFLAAFSLPAYAQVPQETILLNPYGTDYREPKIYGQANSPDPTPSSTSTSSTTTTSTTTSTSTGTVKPKVTVPVKKVTPSTTAVTSTTTTETDAFGISNATQSSFFNSLKKKLKLDFSGYGKTCEAGGVQAIPWTLTNKGIDVQDSETLSLVAKQAIEADHRLRRISIDGSDITLYYLEPARLFGFIPVNYIFQITANIDTFQFKLKNPSWLKFATHYHNEIAQTVSNNLYNSFSQENISFLINQSAFVRHATVIEQTAHAFIDVPIYPFAGGFWICVFIPYFIIFLILIGFIIGLILYLLSKRRKQRHIYKVKYSKDQDDDPIYTSRFTRNPSDDTETLEDYMKTKRFKDENN